MNTRELVLILLGGGAIYYVLNNQTDVETYAQQGAANLTAVLTGWQNAGEGPTWIPILNQAEMQNGIPQNLLARQAFAESSFAENIIRGIKSSSAGAMGIMQMLPTYFASVNVPTPYTDTDVSAQIAEAATLMASLYREFGTWELALAAYNAGSGNVQKYGGIPPFPETQNYVSSIIADIPQAASA